MWNMSEESVDIDPIATIYGVHILVSFNDLSIFILLFYRYSCCQYSYKENFKATQTSLPY